MSDDLTLTLSRDLAAPPATVWRCLTEPDLLRQWFAPRPVETTEVEIDPTPGGIFRTVMEVPGHGTMTGVSGCILVADPGRRLVWTNTLGPGFRPNALGSGPTDFAHTAIIEIAATATGCRYVATVLHATSAARQTHADMGFHDGWGTAADQLGLLAAGL